MTRSTKPRVNGTVLHPGQILLDNIINAHDLTMQESANLLGIGNVHLSLIVNGKTGLSPEMCHRITIVFGGNPQEWANLQSQYELEAKAEKVKKLNLKPYKPK